MREMTDEEVAEVQADRVTEWSDSAEKWFTFEHAGVWRETTKQFLGAVRSHGKLDCCFKASTVTDVLRPKPTYGITASIPLAR